MSANNTKGDNFFDKFEALIKDHKIEHDKREEMVGTLRVQLSRATLAIQNNEYNRSEALFAKKADHADTMKLLFTLGDTIESVQEENKMLKKQVFWLVLVLVIWTTTSVYNMIAK
jgi:hypothetical protein